MAHSKRLTIKGYEMSTFKKSRYTLAFVLALGGCVSVTTARLESGPSRTALTPLDVTIYRNVEQVGAPYIEVALLNGAGNYSATNESQMFEKMRKRAAEAGANGVILGEVKEPTTGVKVASALLGTPANRKSQAIAIFVTRPSTK